MTLSLPAAQRGEYVERVEHAASTVTLTLFVVAVAVVWPVAELTRFVLEKLFCRRG